MYSVEPVEQLTLFPQGTREHANLLVLPGTDKARKMTAISGRKCFALYKPYNLGGLLVRTLLDTLHWDSTLCYLTWRVSVTPGKRLLFRLQLSELHTEGSEYLFWPTPTTDTSMRTKKYAQGGTPLSYAVRFWPTPTASQDYKPIRPLAPSEANGSHGTMLVGAVGHCNPELIGGKLNPQWVEWLMGFPQDWTNTTNQDL